MDAAWVKLRVSYFMGSPMSASDLQRISAQSASMAFVIGSSSATNPDQEDQDNLLRAFGIHKTLPTLRLRCHTRASF